MPLTSNGLAHIHAEKIYKLNFGTSKALNLLEDKCKLVEVHSHNQNDSESGGRITIVFRGIGAFTFDL